jgi:hypothetical protein
MTIDTQKLAEDIDRVLYSDTTGFISKGEYANIIRQQQEVIQVLSEALKARQYSISVTAFAHAEQALNLAKPLTKGA